jgi:Pin2-interacting protein X1
MLGIGMQHHQNDPNGIAWRQNRDFENLLQRLNNGTEAIGSFHQARGSSPSEEEEVSADVVDSAHDADEGADATKLEKKKKKQKKRKTLQEEEVQGAHDKRERKKRKKSKSDVAPADDASPSLEAQAAATTTPESTPVPLASIAAPAPIRALYVADSRLVLNSRTYFRLLYDSPRAHRARIIAAKQMAASNSAALAEILGIPSSSSSTAVTAPASPSPLTNATAATTPTPTPRATSDAQEEDPLQKLTTAAQSVDDYLRAKLGAKASAQPRPKHSFALRSVTHDADKDDDDDAPRAGLGAARLALTGRLDEPVFATSKFAAMFARGQVTAGAEEGKVDEDDVERAETQDDVGNEERRKNARRLAKEERRREKEERRQRKEEAKSRVIAEPVAEPPNGALVVELSIGEVRPGHAKRRKHRESDGQHVLLEDNPNGGTATVQNKKRKHDKSRKTGREANP